MAGATSPPHDHTDDPAIDGLEVLVRRIKPPPHDMSFVDEGTNEIKLRGRMAFIIGHDGCSVYRGSLLRKALLRPQDTAGPDELPAMVEVASVRASGFGVRDDPWPDGRNDAHPRDRAHALIVNPNGIGGNDKRRRLDAVGRAARVLSWDEPR